MTLRRRLLWSTAALLVVAFGIQLAFVLGVGEHPLSDVVNVYRLRHVGPGALPYLDRPMEYPVLIGFTLYGAAVVAWSSVSVFVVTALLTGSLALVATVLLGDRAGARAWRWALAPPLALYVFQNWDLLAIVPMIVGILAFERRRDGLSGGALAFGAAAKLFPAVLLPPLLAVRLAERDRRGTLRLVVGAAVVSGAINLPVLLASPSGWWSPFRFQSARRATWGSVWSYAFKLPGVHGLVAGQAASAANAVSLAVLGIGLGWLVMRAWRHALAPAAVAAAAVAIFVLSNKVYSPTYDLWLVPFFVLLALPRRLWVTFCALDLAVYLTVYGYFQGLHSVEFVHAVLPTLVFARAGVLIAVIWLATRAPPRARGGTPDAAARPPVTSVG